MTSLRLALPSVTVALFTLVSFIARGNPYLMNRFHQIVREYVGYQGTGADGALVINGVPNGPTNPIYTDNTRSYLTAAATAGATTITMASTTGLVIGDEVLIIQMLGAGTGKYEVKTISSLTGTTLTFATGISNAYPTYSAGVSATQVIRVNNYSSVTLNSGGTLSVHAFDGQTGGVMYFRSSGAISVNYNATLSGTITVKGKGYLGGATNSAGTGPGAGAAGAGGQNTTSGMQTTQAIAGSGGGGGSGGAGAAGGGILFIKTNNTLTIDGNILASGNAALASTNGGGGAGGSIYISASTITKTTTCGTIDASPGAGNGTGTAGGNGRIFMNFLTTLGCQNATPSGITAYQRYKVY